MAALNQFNREETVLFEQVLEKFDADNTIAKEAALFRQPGTTMQRTGDTIWRPVPMISTTVDALDVSSKIGSITQLAVPATLSSIKSVVWEEDAQEMRDPLYRDRKATSAAQSLSAAVNFAMATNIALWGSLTVKKVGALTGYDDISIADALMVENEVLGNSKTMVLNPRDYNSAAGDLAKRTLMKRSESALSDANLGPIANFNTFVTSFGPPIVASVGGATGGGVTVNGANQRLVPKSNTSTPPVDGTPSDNNDNRTMNLTITGSGATNRKAGDKFTIAGVNALSHITKADTGQLKTFTIIQRLSATSIRIAPPIIDGAHAGTPTDAEKDYANVASTPVNTAVLTFLNTVTKPSNPFFMNDSIEVFSGNLAFSEDMAGVSVQRQMTDSGIEIIFAKQGTASTGKAFYRLTIFFGVTNLNPEMNGNLIANQT